MLSLNINHMAVVAFMCVIARFGGKSWKTMQFFDRSICVYPSNQFDK